MGYEYPQQDELMVALESIDGPPRHSKLLEMSPRARISLLIPTGTSAVIGILAISNAHLFSASQYAALRTIMPLWLWGAIWLVAAALCAYAAIVRSVSWARLGLGVSALQIGSLVGCILAASATGFEIGPILTPVALGYFAFHLVMIAQPFRMPLEDLVRTMDK